MSQNGRIIIQDSDGFKHVQRISSIDYSCDWMKEDEEQEQETTSTRSLNIPFKPQFSAPPTGTTLYYPSSPQYSPSSPDYPQSPHD